MTIPTKASILAAGIRPGELATVLGVHPTSVSDMINGRTGRATPGSEAIVWLWPRLTEEDRKSLLSGVHSNPGQPGR